MKALSNPFFASLSALSWSLVEAAQIPERNAIGHSPRIQDGLVQRAPDTCAVLQDGRTSEAFPWTHGPLCLTLGVDASGRADHRHGVYCVYTNAGFSEGRGISIVTSPESAIGLSREVWETGVGRGAAWEEEEEAWEAKEVGEGKGVGLFARRPVDSGETVVAESPVLMVSVDVLGSASHAQRRTLFEKAVEQLPGATRRMFLALSRRGGESAVEDIVNVNSMRAKIWDGSIHLLVVPEAARINHACRPNAHYRFSDTTLTLTAFALAPILPGQEINFSYGFSASPHAERISALRSTWNFTCTCPLCSSSPSHISLSDKRLADIAGLKAMLPSTPKDVPQFIALIPELVRLLEEEELYVQLPMYEELLAYAWSAVGSEGRARAWAERARVHWGIVAGEESWEARRSGMLAADVQGHYTWGTWNEDIWEGVGVGHPWDEREGDDEHDHHEH